MRRLTIGVSAVLDLSGVRGPALRFDTCSSRLPRPGLILPSGVVAETQRYHRRLGRRWPDA